MRQAVAAVLVLAAYTCLAITCGQCQDTSFLEWQDAEDPRAICNDRTQAGFFLRRASSSTKWVVYLESGGLCFSNETCNRRFFVSQVRNDFNSRADPNSPDFPPYGRFDTQQAWDNTVVNGAKSHTAVINPLMSSMRCFQNRTEYFPNGFKIEGRDILDGTDDRNPYRDYNHVVIPYCSSDVWLADDGAETVQDCFNFEFNPQSTTLQFAFRGKVIFRSIFSQLIDSHGMDMADEVVLVGSSAGGLGVVNHASWVRDQLDTNTTSGANTELKIIFDSAWFINFHNNIFEIFDGATSDSGSVSSQEQENTDRLLRILEQTPACNDTTLGYPCCLSAHCVLTQRDSSGVPYYPSNQHTFAVLSIYDVFLLAPALSGVGGLDSSEESNVFNTSVEFLRLIGEYGGEMNSTLSMTDNQMPSFSYYVTQCLQHIYLTTSNLWGEEGSSVFGSSSIEISMEVASFSHSIQSGRWSSNSLAILQTDATTNTTQHVTIRDALNMWSDPTLTSALQFRDSCQGPYCNLQCPDQFTLGQLTSNNWPLWSRIVIVAIILVIAMLALVFKMLFVCWLFVLERKQDAYLESLDNDYEETDGTLMFPDCDDETAVSVACLDLSYAVTFKAKKAKDEKKDKTAPIVLSNLADDDESSESEDEFNESTRKTARYRRRSTRGFADVARKTIKAVQSQRRLSRIPTKTKLEEVVTKKGTSMDDSVPLSPYPDSPANPDTTKKLFGYSKKEILKGISVYFNPGELIGIMGPSGCGKTTFLDLLTGRRKIGTTSGEIYVNGVPMDEIRDWYIANTGYVLQLASPYYEELTVRENLTLAAQIKLPSNFTAREKFERVEQVMEVTGLLKLSDTVVGGSTGPGLSGGQKRRLVIALQLLKLPSVIFLDEPTSGLDATSSMELLSHLNKLADSNRTVILTIHQPRLEIFHMFHRLVLLSDGKIAYHGVPDKAYEVFVNGLRTRLYEQGLIIPSLEDHNPADVIMDMLGNPKMRQLITKDYQTSDEPRLVRKAIMISRWKEYRSKSSSVDSLRSAFQYALVGSKKVSRRHGDWFTRWAALEARGAKRLTIGAILYLPLFFLAFGIILGTVYIQRTQPLLVLSGFCVFSTASALFMFPALHLYFERALQVYAYERADGIGRSFDLVIQGFIRFSSLAFLPAVFSTAILYLLLVNHNSYDPLVFLQVVLVNITLNQCWTALLIALICAFPLKSFRISPALSAVFGFTSGFFIPIGALHWGYRWIAYINPNYYGLSAVSYLLLIDFDTGCAGSEFQCYLGSGPYLLGEFFFSNINPYLHILILLVFTLFFIGLAIFANALRHTSIRSKLKRVRAVISRNASDSLSREFDSHREHYEKSFSLEEGCSFDDPTVNMPVRNPSPLSPIHEGEEEGYEEQPAITPGTKARGNWRNALGKVSQETSETTFITPNDKCEAPKEATSGWNKVRRVQLNDQRPATLQLRDSQGQSPERETFYLHEGQSHQVWRPKKSPQLANLVKDLMKAKEQEKKATPTTPAAKIDLRSRQRTLYSRVLATQAVLKETTDELLEEEEEEEEEDEIEARNKRKSKLTLHAATKKISANILKQKSAESEKKSISDVVSHYLAQARAEGASQNEDSQNAAAPLNRRASRHKTVRKQSAITPGAIPVKKWRQIIRENKDLGILREMSQEHSDHSDEETKSKVKSKSPRTSAVSFAEFHDDQKSKSSGVTTTDGEPLHKPILKKDSHGILKKSKLAEVKASTTARRQSYQRQDPLKEWSTSPGNSLEDSGEYSPKMDNSESSKKSPNLDLATAIVTELPPVNGNANTNSNNNNSGGGSASKRHSPTVVSHAVTQGREGSLDDQFARPSSPSYFAGNTTPPPPRKTSPSDIFIAMRNQESQRTTPPSQSRGNKTTQKMRLKRNVNIVADVSEGMRSRSSSSGSLQSQEEPPYSGSWI